ncbi:GntR family transcriptional regulator [Sporosarcina sp. BI001-red]|uniref:GntR family transcriptional regulator n=1 Tax=Sporosarcina sp. BI001-red TaxID=2282866 RepID=UPI000E23368C|nr:GntR family transcriptional regulator [Sporosarcina sp. BI001-red]REB08769.1 GntR family transcriptional regulator [Sporosarcina sp. BI001-red]
MQSNKLVANAKIPLYKQLKLSLMKYIDESLMEGDMLPIEPEIEKTYGVSRITVRRTIDELVADGIVKKIQGKGTFVESKSIVQTAGTITSWTEEMQQKGKKIETENTLLIEMEPTQKLKKELQLSPNEKILCLKRIRLANEEPIAIMINYIRAKYVPGLLERGLQRESLYETLEDEYGIQLKQAKEKIQARSASDLEAIELRISPQAALLHITRVSYLEDGTPFELVEMSNRGDRYAYHIDLFGRNKLRNSEGKD